MIQGVREKFAEMTVKSNREMIDAAKLADVHSGHRTLMRRTGGLNDIPLLGGTEWLRKAGQCAHIQPDPPTI
jgi:hypothetical protein